MGSEARAAGQAGAAGVETRARVYSTALLTAAAQWETDVDTRTARPGVRTGSGVEPELPRQGCGKRRAAARACARPRRRFGVSVSHIRVAPRGRERRAE